MKITFYKLQIKDTDDIYIGSTTNIDKRINTHRLKTKINYPLKLYKTINEAGGWSAVEKTIFGTIECVNNSIRYQKEQLLMDIFSATLNSKRAYVSPEMVKALKYKPIQCQCGTITSACNISHHIKSKNHIKLLLQLATK